MIAPKATPLSIEAKLVKRLALSAIAAAAILLAGCRSGPSSKPLSQLTPTESRGYVIFQSQCAPCHLAGQGPDLQGMFRQQYLPSGAPANDDRVRATILQGRGMMPGFNDQLDDRQLQDLIAYLHTL